VEEQLSLDDALSHRRALARPADPYTSQLAADAMTPERTTPTRARVLLYLYGKHGRTDDEIIEAVDGSPSSLRTRRHELTAAGFVHQVGEGESALGNPSLLWALTERGDAYVREHQDELRERGRRCR
jgi:predicted ArsR family transcriptional regulator